MSIGNGLLHPVYLACQAAHSAWIRASRTGDFGRVERFCLFAGYPRSGHSLVGAMLNAHPDAVIAHEVSATGLIDRGCSREDLYARILARAWWFNMRRNQGVYSYEVPTGWQGRYRRLRVIGDKRGGQTSRYIAAHPDFLDRLREFVGVPIRLIHVVRNPFDNITAIALADGRTLEESTDFYFSHCEATAGLDRACADNELITVSHERMFQEPQQVLLSLCRFLGLEPDPKYVDACCSVIFPKPTYTRRKVDWPAALVRETEDRMRQYPFLGGYAFDDDR